mgnify:CR=1 FL=1
MGGLGYELGHTSDPLMGLVNDEMIDVCSYCCPIKLKTAYPFYAVLVRAHMHM